jgi:GNAT superfamily N-acetyltransferase
MLQLTRITDELPDDFDAMRAEAAGEGYRHIERLAREWADASERFDKPGEALFAAFVEGELAGVGGLTREPSAPEAALRRARRFYVRPRFRGEGAGRALASAIIAEAFGQGADVTVHAGPDAPDFWERLGFAAVEGAPYSHRLSAPR